MLVNRRRYLSSVTGAATAIGSGRLFAQSDEAVTYPLTGVRLEPFVDPLVILPVLQRSETIPGSDYYRIRISEFSQKLHRDLPPTVVWGFEGSTPGPVISARRGRAVTVDWLNRLPEKHRLPIDHTLHGAEKDVPEVRTTIHLHGGHVSSINDGWPMDWVTPGRQQRTFYPNQQAGATLWYHDHAMGITRLNLLMGLAGFYLLQDPQEERLGLPAGSYDIALALQDRILDPRGENVYPAGASYDSPWVPEFFGSHILVNGRVSPYFEVEPRLYRFRLLNMSNSRFYQLALTPGQQFMQIGSDGGLLAEPVMREEMLLAPGERIEVLIDFSGREGRRIMLVNYGPAPYPLGGQLAPGYVLQFRVNRRLNGSVPRIPERLNAIPRLPESAAVKTRRLKLIEIMPANGHTHRMSLDGRRFMDPVTEDPVNGSVEIWELVNATVDTHPIHLHAIHFQLLDRCVFDYRRHERTSEVVLTGKTVGPAPEESGWKDTIQCPPGQVTRIIVPFQGEPGRFVWHCHMLEHEDNEMMRPYLLRA